MFIDASTTRAAMLDAIYGEGNLIDHFIRIDKDPEFMSDDEIREELIAWIQAGDECAGA